MAALTKLLIAVFYVQVILIALGFADIPEEALYNFLSNPTDWEGSVFSAVVSDLLLSVGGIAIIAGTYLIKNDLIVFAGLGGIFLSFGKPLANLWLVIAAQTSNTVAMLFVSPIIILYVITIIAWWRGRD